MITSYDTKTQGRRWRVRIYDRRLGRNVHVGSYATRREARDAEAAALLAETPITASDATVVQWRELWIAAGEGRVRESTRRWWAGQTRAFALEHGHRPLSAIDRLVAMQWATEHRATVQALSAMWTAAVQLELVPTNPWRGLGQQRRRHLEPGWLTATDVAALEQAARDAFPGPYGRLVAALVLTGAYVGLRPGEIAGLRWGDLDPAQGRIHVRRQAESRTREFTAPKNGLARTVVYPPVVQRAITAAPRLHRELVFVGPRGGILFGPTRDRVWGRVRARAGRPDMVLHELRHYCATWLTEQGLSSSDVAIQLGHTDGGALVESTYGHARADPALERLTTALATATTTQAEEAAS